MLRSGCLDSYPSLEELIILIFVHVSEKQANFCVLSSNECKNEFSRKTIIISFIIDVSQVYRFSTENKDMLSSFA